MNKHYPLPFNLPLKISFLSLSISLLATSFSQAQENSIVSRTETVSVVAESRLQTESNTVFSTNGRIITGLPNAVNKPISSIKLGNNGPSSSATGACDKGAVSTDIDKVYGNLNTFTFADDIALAPLENFYLEQMEIIFLLDYNVEADEIFLDFYRDAATGGPGAVFPVSLNGAQVEIENLGEYGTTIKDIMLITVTFAAPVLLPGDEEGTSYWAGVRITHNGTENSAASIGTNTQGQTFYVNRTGSWEKNTVAYSDVPQQDLLYGFYGQCEEFLGVNDNDKLSGINLFPNPLNGNIFYINSQNLIGEQVEMNLTDITGRHIYSTTLDIQTSQTAVSLKHELNVGIYLVTLKSGSEQNTFRLLKQ